MKSPSPAWLTGSRRQWWEWGWTIGAAGRGGGTAAVLGKRLGNRYGYPGVLRHCSVGSCPPGSKKAYPPGMDSAVCEAVAGSAAAATRWHRSQPDNGNSARFRAVAFAREPLHALRV